MGGFHAPLLVDTSALRFGCCPSRISHLPGFRFGQRFVLCERNRLSLRCWNGLHGRRCRPLRINHKFVAVKVRVYNSGQQSVTVKPEDVSVEDTLAGRTLATISGSELARRMRRPYNWARFSVNPVAGELPETPLTSDQVNPRLLEMMRAMSARMNASPAPVLSGRSVLYTDTPERCRRTHKYPSPPNAGRCAAFAIARPPVLMC